MTSKTEKQMMTVEELPVGKAPKAITFPHFPAAFQAVVWRNWGLVPRERLCRVLSCTLEELRQTAESLGLDPELPVDPVWCLRSCNTLIRANWHLLQYDQLLELLGWTAGELGNQLMWDDFLWIKLGFCKPQCERARYRKLTEEEREKTARLRETVRRHFPDGEMSSVAKPLAFYDEDHDEPVAGKGARAKGLRVVYSYSARYGDPLLDASLDPYPEKLLVKLQRCGVNAIYLQGILTQLTLFEDLPEISAGYETRQKNLRALIRKAAKYGIGVYLYLNEPRGFTPDMLAKHPFLREKYSSPVDVDFNVLGMCTSKPAVREYLRKNLRELALAVPGLAGVFTIVCSENPTNCWSHSPKETCCPECMKRGAPEVFADVDAIIAEALHSVDPNIRVLCWDWGFYDNAVKPEFIKRLPKDVTLLCTSENSMPIAVGGVKVNIKDYSISQPGPSPVSCEQWRTAQARGLKCAAKIMLSNSWELSAVPYIPATFLVEEHLDNLRRIGVDDYIISWTLGGWPSINMELLNKSHDQMVVDHFGADALVPISKALKGFSEAFRQFPFAQGVVYHAPHNAGPMGLLYEQPTGYAATMVGFPYDDLERQRQFYPEDIFENQWKLLSDSWRRDGLLALEAARSSVDAEHLAAYEELRDVATACWCHFRSAYCQFAFHRRRNDPSAGPELSIPQLLEEEIELAKTLLRIVRRDSRIGFEATNHYAYTVNDLREKVLNCEYLLEKFRKA